MKISKRKLSRGMLVVTIATSLTPLSIFADDNKNVSLKGSEEIITVTENNNNEIVIELNAYEILAELEKEGIDDNSTDNGELAFFLQKCTKVLSI